MENIRIRPVRESDESALADFYARLSPESRRARFLSCAKGLDPSMAHTLCCVVKADEAGFVAVDRRRGGKGIVGHVCLTESDDESLEIGIAVADELQGKGVGRRLFVTALAWAELNSIPRLVATAFTDNWRVLRLLSSSRHATVVCDAGAGVCDISIDLLDHSGQQRAA